MTVSRALTLSLCIALNAGGASAYVSGGHEYEASCNADGYVLISKFPVTRTIGQGASTQYISGIEKLYLGRSCDAFHALYGTGQWCWANGGFKADFADAMFGFARQDLDCASNYDLGSSCRC